MIKNQWYAIFPAKAIKPGQLIAVRRLNLDLVLFRNASGELGCLVDRCSHRGAQISKGSVVNEHIQCPFHGLEFDSKGACVLIPANGRNSTEDLSRYNVRRYIVKEKHGIVFLWYGDEDPETDIVPFFDELSDEGFVYSEFEDHWDTHYSRAIENQLDVVHLPFIHKTTIGRGNRTLVNAPAFAWQGNKLFVTSNNEVDVGQQPKKTFEADFRAFYLAFTFPNLWINHISDKMIVMIYFAPVDDANTILYLRFYNKMTPIKLVNKLISAFGKWGNLIVERQDKRVVITQEPKASSLRGGEKLLLGDRPIVEYRRRREALKQGSA